MAAAFRTVRNNTIKIAEEIPEDKYSFKAAADSRTVGETLVHVGLQTSFPMRTFAEMKLTDMSKFDVLSFFGEIMAEAQKPRTKAQIVELLRQNGDKYAAWLEGCSDSYLAEMVTFPVGAQPPTKTRFEVLLGVKEHEMHHRGQLMMMQRMLGIVPHLTRQMQERMAAMQAGRS